MSGPSTDEVPPPGGHFETTSATRVYGIIDPGPTWMSPLGFPHRHAEAALANRDIRCYLGDPDFRHIWTEQGVRRHPTVRVEFEHVHVIGGLGESLAASRYKNFGRYLGVHPLRPEDPVHPCRILFVYQETSPFNRRVEQRKALKRLLGRRYRTLVTRAARSTKRDFLKYDISPQGVRAIRRTLGLDPGRFWRVAKGREFLDLPAPPRQLLLFDPDTDISTDQSLISHTPISQSLPSWHNDSLLPPRTRGGSERNVRR